MSNPARIVPDAMQALLALGASAEKGGVPSRTLGLVPLAALIISIATINVWNRLNVATRQVAGSAPRWEG